MTLIRFKASQEQDVDLSRTYDAIVVGSGAAGGMAAHVLTSQGMKVLLLEAGKKIDINAELRSMQWPYEHPRRGEAPPGYHAIRFNEYNVRKPPYAKGSAFKHVFSYVGGWGGSDYVRTIRTRAPSTPGCARGCWAARRTSGPASRCDSRITTSRARRTTATAKIGRSPTPISSPTTTRSISTSASAVTRRICHICRTACSSGPTS